MARLQAQHRVVAWMALVALWLTIAAPVVSRLAMAAEAAAPAASGMACAEHMGHATHPSSPAPATPATDRCAYCTLLGESPVVLTAAWVPVLLPRTPYLPPALPHTRSVHRHAWLAPTPRGPPPFADA